ncbi:MAG: glycosyltransferase family 4 protein [Halobacteriota archaeon]|jgi:Glycosyltransferase|nr:glycosyltransferase family 4 protein [Euryarchaeota archaeon]
MKSLRIAHIYELGPRPDGVLLGGIEVALLELSKSLTRLGHEVTIINGASNGAAEFHIEDVKVKTIDLAGTMRRTWDPANLRFARQVAFPFAALAAELSGFDIYHGHFYTSGVAANVLARKYRGAAVNTIHGSYYDIWRYIEPPIISSMYRLTERTLAPMLARMSKMQIHTGGYFARRVIKWGAPPDKVVTIHNGFDPHVFKPGVAASDLVGERTILFTARRLVEKNGLEYLISAMPNIIAQYDAELVIAGDGPHKQHLQKLVARHNLQNDVSFIGAVPHSKLPQLISASDIVVIPSLMEASSLFLIESMACKRPVVATNVGGIPEILNEGCGVLVSPRDTLALSQAINLLIADQGLRDDLATEAYSTVRGTLTWDKIAQQTENAYATAVA